MPVVRQMRNQGPTRLPAGALSALAALERNGPMTAGELARHECVSGPMVTRIAKLLESEGLVDRAADPGDARVSRFTVTDVGGKALSESRAAKDTWLAEQLTHLKPTDRDALAAVIPVLRLLVEDERGR